LERQQATVIIIPESGSSVRQFKFSRTLIAIVGCLVLLCVTAVPFFVYDYCTLKATLPSKHALEREVADQRAQIQSFAKKINGLKTEIVAIREFEEKIRDLADVDESAKGDSMLGVGGPTPEDLDASIPLTEEHHSLVREMHAQVEDLEETLTVHKETLGELHEYLETRQSMLVSTPTIRPTTGWRSSGFGYRTSPFTGRREFHQGLDIATRSGTPVIAPADGTVTFVGSNGALGKTVTIDHGYGVVTRYGHLKKLLVKRGAEVKRGDTIGLVGNTGRSTAPHLHYEVHLNGIPVNPSKYILN
jgi:murein DD-endopeptidase MepM/ murein hydrolase activator NlpD